MNRFDIAIHGAGFVGQALALALVQNGLRVALIASQQPSKAAEYTDIRAFALGHSAKAFLKSIDAWPDAQAATAVKAMCVYGDTSGELYFQAPTNNDTEALALNWIVDVPALAHQLQAQVSSKPDIIRLTGRNSIEAKLHVICEGKHSQLRQQLGVQVKTIHYPQQAIAARLVCQKPHQQIARQWFNTHGEVLALLPLGDVKEVALVWSLRTSRAQAMMAAENEAFTQTLTAACGEALGAMTLTTARALWPLQLTTISKWCGCFGTTNTAWVLAGDAAHTVHPLAGQGLNLGLGDAAQLARSLADLEGTSPLFNPKPSALQRTLRRYARSRQAAASTVTSVTDGLHLLFTDKRTLAAPLRNHGLSLLNRFGTLKNKMIQYAQ